MNEEFGEASVVLAEQFICSIPWICPPSPTKNWPP
jgi:hypothetical protein